MYLRPNKDTTHRACCGNRGFALVISLVLLAAITLFVVALFAIGRNDLAASDHYADAYRARLAARAGFEDAANLLMRETLSDDFTVSTHRAEHDDEDYFGRTFNSRYAYISKWNGTAMEHVPLFSGGLIHETEAAIDIEALAEQLTPLDPEDPTQLPDPAPLSHQPVYELDSSLPVARGLIESLWKKIAAPTNQNGQVTVVGASGESRPFVSFLEPADQDPKNRIRYAYWIEDLQGFPNLDVIGSWTDHFQPEDTSYARDHHWFGYGALDTRSAPGTAGEKGTRFELLNGSPLPGLAERSYGYQFPKGFRGQKLVGQIAPGLSPRELHLTAYTELGEEGYGVLGFFDHELHAKSNLLYANGSAPILHPEASNHYAVGLLPYKDRPLIPRGFDYPAEGEPRSNLNLLVAEEEIDEIADHIATQIPNFAERGGGFPEDYLQQLAMSIVDYADEDSLPNTATGIRGLEAYPLINEFFLRFEYLGAVDGDADGSEPESWIARFRATPYIELWNPTNQPLEIDALEFDFFPYSELSFEWFGETYDLHGENNANVLLHEPRTTILSVDMEPNEYLVLGGIAPDETSFGSITWEFVLPKDPAKAELEIERLETGTDEVARAYYDLMADGEVIDRSGRPPINGTEITSLNGVGIWPLAEDGPGAANIFGDGTIPLEEGEYIMSMTAPTLHHGAPPTAAAPDPIGLTHFGDPLMAYHSAALQTPLNYLADATPGGRNVRQSAIDGGLAFTDEVRHRDWPDRGFDTEPGSRPTTLEMMPTDVPATLQRPDLAPFRLSNLQRYYSLTELGHIHDPIMWSLNGGEGNWEILNTLVGNLPEEAEPDQQWGGGNTLRIGRREHRVLEALEAPASKLLDIFQVGHPGTNCQFGSWIGDTFVPNDTATAYTSYDPRDHQPPPSAPDAASAKDRPYSDVYDPELHAQGNLKEIYGHLNLNSIPRVGDFSLLLEGLFTADNQIATEDPNMLVEGVPGFRSALSPTEILSNQVQFWPGIAGILERARPFYAPSQVADIIALASSDINGPPRYHSDAMAEEIFARIHNTTTLSSRSFRIYALGELLDQNGRPTASSARVYEVSMQPVRDEESGEIERVKLVVLSERDL